MKQEQAANTRRLLLEHCRAYPLLQPTDLFKYIHQSALGCEHMVSSEADALAFLQKEYAALSCAEASPSFVEALDGAYSRVSLSSLANGLAPETLAKLFYRSARIEADGETALIEKLKVAKDLIEDGVLPFSLDDFDSAHAEWKADGYPARHHSDAFRKAYHPAYRVIANEYVRLLPLFSSIDRALTDGPLTIAIEGGSASGKTTLSALLEELYDCTVFHADDFFLRPEQRTEARLAEIGGNLDRERLLEEVLIPLRNRNEVAYRRFDCATQTLSSPKTVLPKKLTIVEGAYSMHPDLAPYYDLSVFLDINPEYQRERITKRNTPQLAARFFEEWIPLENLYFSKMQTKERCHLSVKIERNA